MVNKIKDYIVKFREQLTIRKTIIKLFTYTVNRRVLTNKSILDNLDNYIKLDLDIRLSIGEIILLKITEEEQHYIFLDDRSTKGYKFKYIKPYEYHKGPCEVTKEISIVPGDIENLTTKVTTTVGRFMLNYLILVKPFNNKITYINKQFDVKSIEKIIVKQLLSKEISTDEYYKFIDSVFFIGSTTEIFAPTLTLKALTVPDYILKRKKELIEQHKHELNNPLVIAAIEKELVDMDMEYLKGNKALRYYAMLPKVLAARKKMFLIHGGIPKFNKDSNADMEFVPNSLMEGWTKQSLVAITNDTRSGSFSRGHEVIDSGTISKAFARIFSTVSIVDGDCETKKGLKVLLTNDNYKEYILRYIIEKGSITLLTDTNITHYLEQIVIMRSPMYCIWPSYCSICTGDLMKTLDQDNVISQSLNIGGTLLNASMSKMHNTGLKLMEINPSDYLITT